MKKGFLLFSNGKAREILSRSKGVLTCGVATAFLLLFTQSSIAASSQSDFAEHSQNCTASWKLTHPGAVCTKPASFSLNSSELGWKGPVSFSTTYSSLLGLIYNAHLIKTLGSNAAIAGLVNYGNNELRLNATWAYQLMKANRIKVTYEYLNQKLGFDFATGEVHKWVGQNAIGLQDQEYFQKGILNSLGLKLQYIRANSVKLSPALFNQGGTPYLNKDGNFYVDDRNIAGGDEAVLDADVSLLPDPHVKLDLGTGISTLKYRTIFQPSSRKSSIDGLVSIHVIATPKTVLSLSADHTVSSTDLTGEITRLLGDKFATSLKLNSIIGNNGLSDNNAITLSLSFPASNSFSNYTRNTFAEPIKMWASQPAVEMNQVLAVQESKRATLGLQAGCPLDSSLHLVNTTIFAVFTLGHNKFVTKKINVNGNGEIKVSQALKGSIVRIYPINQQGEIMAGCWSQLTPVENSNLISFAGMAGPDCSLVRDTQCNAPPPQKV